MAWIMKMAGGVASKIMASSGGGARRREKKSQRRGVSGASAWRQRNIA